ncbi:MAG TPA: hypothetical protein VH914_09495 [Acidimicrobiia bacterium]|nr:hypothetical protein [Acidimicrobiia bacterium]
MTAAHLDGPDQHDGGFEQRVRAAIAANVDLMDGPPRVVERAMSATRHARRRRRQRWRVAVVVTCAGVAIAAAVAMA